MKKTAKATTKKKAPTDEAVEVEPRFAPVADAFADDRQVTYGKMMASIGLKVNGKIFAMMVKGKFVAKLPKDRVDGLVRSGKGDYFDPGHGRLMKEWVAVARGEAAWVDLAREAYRFVKASSGNGNFAPARESSMETTNATLSVVRAFGLHPPERAAERRFVRARP